MPSQLTITAKTGPASQVTTLVLSNVQNLNLDFIRRVIQVFSPDFPVNPREFDLTGVTTLTDSISSNNHTLVIS
jgi:hypothetical protein